MPPNSRVGKISRMDSRMDQPRQPKMDCTVSAGPIGVWNCAANWNYCPQGSSLDELASKDRPETRLIKFLQTLPPREAEELNDMYDYIESPIVDAP